MISQRCPKCHSSRIRRGYRPTPIWLKILFRYNLLCDNCNWEFTGFAVPGTVTNKPQKSRKKHKFAATADEVKDFEKSESASDANTGDANSQTNSSAEETLSGESGETAGAGETPEKAPVLAEKKKKRKRSAKA